MQVLKYSTQNLCCYRCCNDLGQKHYQIFEKENEEKPIAIYVNKKHMKLADEFPQRAQDYKYFNEMCEIVQTLEAAETENLNFEF